MGYPTSSYRAQPNPEDYYDPNGSGIKNFIGQHQYQQSLDNFRVSNGTYTPKTIDSNDDKYASKTQAELVKAEYADYVNRYQPYEKQLLGLANGTELLDKQLSRISASAKKSQSSRAMSQALRNSRLGVSTGVLQSQSQQRQNQLASGLALAQAKNNTRVATSDLQDSILTGSSGRSVLTSNFSGV
ncbi:hypothetical protein [Gayadomonas joobiniege]|uniref:hypothetical protein n=1 Tax=Gayadomonas joobiniege TaxID=1234606 RepID=UPI000363A7B7|nr:hypothetical protein [Gayadomonas joobiniege]